MSDNDLGETSIDVSVNGQCLNCPDGRFLASADIVKRSSMAHIAKAWPHLPPHVREAIFTLIDGSLAQQQSESEPQ